MKFILSSISKLYNLRLLVVFLYLAKLIFALAMVLPIFLTVDSSLAFSVLSNSLLQHWDMSVIVEIINSHTGALLPLLAVIISGLILYVLLTQFINGGIYYLAGMGRSKNVDWREFFAECGVNFGFHFRITIMMTLVYLLLLPACFFSANFIGLYGADHIGLWARVFFFLQVGFIFLILTIASTFSDTARLAGSAHCGEPIKEILSKAADFYRPRLFKLLGVFIVTYVPFVIIWLIVEYFAYEASGAYPGLIAILIELILFQIASFSRTAQKIWYLISIGYLYRQHDPGRFQPQQTDLFL